MAVIEFPNRQWQKGSAEPEPNGDSAMDEYHGCEIPYRVLDNESTNIRAIFTVIESIVKALTEQIRKRCVD